MLEIFQHLVDGRGIEQRRFVDARPAQSLWPGAQHQDDIKRGCGGFRRDYVLVSLAEMQRPGREMQRSLHGILQDEHHLTRRRGRASVGVL